VHGQPISSGDHEDEHRPHLEQAAEQGARRAVGRSLAERVRCTMYWSVHQYQMPTIGEAMITPNQGKVGSDSGRQRVNASLLARHIATSSPSRPAPRGRLT